MNATPQDTPELRLVELTREQFEREPELVEGLIARDAVHTPGKATNRTAEADLYQRVAADDASAPHAHKRGFALYCGKEKMPRHVVYAYMDKVTEAGDGQIAPEDYPANMANILLDDTASIENPNIAVCYGITNWDLKEPTKRTPHIPAAELLGVAYDKLQSQGVKEVITLSPMPDFDNWLWPKTIAQDSSILDETSCKLLSQLSPKAASPIEAFQALYQDDAYYSLEGDTLQKFNSVLEQVGRYYLLEAEKAGKEDQPNQAFDGVQWFHQGNGAELVKVTAQHQHKGEEALVTHPGDKSQNKLNATYRYVPKRHLTINSLLFKGDAQRPASCDILSKHAAYMGRLVDPPMQDIPLPTP